MKYSHDEMHRLRRILFPKGKRIDLDETYESRSEFDKENVQDNAREAKSITRGILCRANLKSQMNKLHQDVQLMLNSQEPSIDNVMNSTTRFYLQKIREMSSCLEEQIACLTQASQSLISSLPSDHRILRNHTIDNIPIRLFVKILENFDQNSTRSLMRDAMKKLASHRRDPTTQYHNISRIMKLQSAMHQWRSLIVQEKVQQKSTDCQESLGQLSSLLQSFLNEGHLVWSLTNLVREEADYAQILLYDRENSRLYTYIEPTSTLNSHFESMHSMYLKTGESDQIQLRKFELQLQQSLTKICICNKQILKIDRLEQDRDYSSCDVMITQQVDSFRPMSLGAVFMPLVNTAKQVVGVLRLFSIQSAPMQLDIRVTEFLGGIIEAVTGLASRIDEMKQQRKDQRNQMYCKLLPIVHIVQNSISTKEMLSQIYLVLKTIIFFEDMNIYLLDGNTCRPLYQATNPTIYTTIKIMTDKSETIINVGNTKLMRFGGTLLELKHPMVDIPYAAMELLVKMIVSRVEKLEVKEWEEKQRQERYVLMKIENQKETNKVILKNACHRLIGCRTFDMVNTQFMRLLRQLAYVCHGQMFIRVDRHIIQMGNYRIHDEDEEVGRRLRKNRLGNISCMDFLSYELQTDDWKEVQQFNVEKRLTERLSIIFSVGIKANYEKLIEQNLDKFAQCIGKITKYEKEHVDFKPILSWNGNLDPTTLQKQLSQNLQKQCRLLPYDKLEGSLFRKAHRQCALQMPPRLILPLQTESPELQENFQKIEKQTSRQYLQELQQLSRYFGKPIEKVTLLCLTLNNDVIIMAIDGYVGTEPLLTLQGIRNILNIYEEEHKKQQQQKNIYKFGVKIGAIHEYYQSKLVSSLKYAFRLLRVSTQKPVRHCSMASIEAIFKKTLIYSFSSIREAIASKQYQKCGIYTYSNIGRIAGWHQAKYTNTIRNAFNNICKRSIRMRHHEQAINVLFSCLSRHITHTFHLSFNKINIQLRQYADCSVFNDIVRRRLLQAFDMVRKSSEIVCDNRQSFVSSLVGAQGSLKEILIRVKEVEGVDMYLVGKQNMVKFQGGIKIEENKQEKQELRLECRGLTVMWTCKPGFMLTLQYKQYLQMLTKALVDRLMQMKQRMEPTIVLMNMMRKRAIVTTKHHFIKKWRNEVIKQCKKLQYSLVEKAYRLNQEMSTVAESRHRKRLQSKRKGEELNGAKRRVEEITELIEFQKTEIAKIEKQITVRTMMAKMADVVLLRRKMETCWRKWRNNKNIKVQKTKKHENSMFRGGFIILFRIVRKNKQNSSLIAFQKLAVHLAKRRELQRELSYNQSPINNPDYVSLIQECQKTGGRHLLVEQFDERSKLTTVSKIEPIEVMRSTSPKNTTKYISQNVPPSKKIMTTPRLSNSVNENIRQKIIEQGMRSRASGAQTTVNYKAPHPSANSPVSNPSAYKLNPNTINFLKKFGREALNQSDIN